MISIFSVLIRLGWRHCSIKRPRTQINSKKKPSLLSPFTSDCYNGVPQDYQGTQSHTMTGRTCQAWSAQSPQKHANWGDSPAHFKHDDALPDNYCRALLKDTEHKAPWCYTTDPDKRWEFCGISKCTAGSSTLFG